MVKAAAKVPLDKRPDFGKICSVAGLYCTISGMLNGVALTEVGTPVGYTSGPCVNLGRFLAASDPAVPKIFGVVMLFYAGGIVAGLAPNSFDGDAVFEGRVSPGMVLSACMLALGAFAKKNLSRPVLATYIWALAQGLMNAITSKFSAAPIRATHTAGGQTDAAISLGQAIVTVSQGQPAPPLRKAILNAVCCLGMVCGGLLAGRYHKRWGTYTALVPAAVLGVTATILPALIAPPSSEEKPEESNK